MILDRLFRRRIEQTSVAVADEPVPVASPVDLKLGDVEMETEYNRVAQKLQVLRRPRASWRILAAALEELMIPVYDLEKVKAFLAQKAQDAARSEAANSVGGSASWVWRPLRICDVVAREPGTYGYRHGNGEIVDHWAYGNKVPLPVLLAAERIEDHLPGEVAFYVSDIQHYPDPFLAVILKADPDKTMFVVERWDEPDFRG